MSRGSRQLAVGVVALATVLLAGYGVVAALLAFTIDLAACHREAGRGTVGLLAAAAGGPVVALLLAAAAAVLAGGGTSRPLAVLVGIAAAAAAFLVGAGAQACPEASPLQDDAEGGVRFAGLPVLVDVAVVVAGAAWAAAALWRRGEG